MMIYHMLAKSAWDERPIEQDYAGDTLATEGFIHCTGDRHLLVDVANTFYRNASGDYVVLWIEEELVRAAIRWEHVDDHIFPHIYGALNTDAVARVTPFPRGQDGQFLSIQDDRPAEE